MSIWHKISLNDQHFKLSIFILTYASDVNLVDLVVIRYLKTQDSLLVFAEINVVHLSWNKVQLGFEFCLQLELAVTTALDSNSQFGCIMLL